MPSCIESVLQRKYYKPKYLGHSKCQQTSLICILSYSAEPVGDEKKFIWDFWSGAHNYHGKLEMFRGYFPKFNFVFLCY